ncbi:MAG TPA: peptide-methionine (S)-S-oxide reductase MsrA [Dongiaceae bacterium]|nr:peptide-methionine (S)-S-oxide reductase MsrA [Dongiaceae bacterium]
MLSKSSLRHAVPIALAAAMIAVAAWQPWSTTAAAEDAVVIPAPAIDLQPGPRSTEVAVLAGGCFWGVQGVFQHVDGVTRAVSGYAGGDANGASYKLVSRGATGHAESVEITYDPRTISYGKILQIYFSVAHDPTQFNYQGPDIGPQYRSAIFPTSEEQARVARAYIAQLDQAHVYGDTIVTTIEPGHTFYPAEDYHQDYLTLNPTQPYIVINDLPKIANLKRVFPELYREEPVLVMAGSSTN